MKTNARLLLRLYPAAWRRRYGSEFEALLEESDLNWCTCFDLLKGAMKMHFSVLSLPKTSGFLAGMGLLLGFGASFMLTPRYVSTASLRYSGGADVVEQLIQTQNEVLSRTSLSALMQAPQLDLYSRERSTVPLDNVVETMRKDIHVWIAQPGTGTFSISFVYGDPTKARATVQALVTRFIDALSAHRLSDAGNESAIEQLQERVAELEKRLNIQPLGLAAPRVGLEVLDPPGMPLRPLYPNRAICAVTGFGCGIVLALVIHAFRRSTNRTLPLPV